ncbi:hypothetical protein JCM10908_003977 [Rhodotorula pacifica]|uniref:uncharacterized protein n=1 Tax=Rhodotorula pacifica TaxID=1495444 RepID=UPI00318095E8
MSLVRGQIDDFVVASFPSPTPRSSAFTRTATRTTVSSVSYTNQPKTDHRIAVASPRVGLAVYDLEDQTPLSSISVGPSFTPTTAPIARSTPLTTTESESTRVKSLRKTWVGVQTAADGDDNRAEIWCFHEDENRDGSTPSADAAKAVWPISEPLAALAAPRTLPSHIVFLSEKGTLALAPQDDLTRLVSLPAPPLPASASKIVSQSLRLVPLSSAAEGREYLPASLLAALPSTTASQPHLAIIVRSDAPSSMASAAPAATDASLTGAGKKKHKKQSRPSAASVIEAAEASTSAASTSAAVTPSLCEIELVLLDAAISIPDEFEPRQGMIRLGRVVLEGASQVVVSDEGFVTALNADSTLSSHRLSFTTPLVIDTYPTLFFPPTSSATDDLDPLLDLSLTLVKSISLSPSALIPSRASLLPLHSSFVALASPRPRAALASTSSSATDSVAAAATAVSVTYWDTRFGSVIAATELAVPAAVASNPDEVAVSLSRAGRRTAIVVLEPEALPSAPSDASEQTTTAAARRTVLFGLPLNVLPSASVLAAVVGKHTLTGRFIAASSSSSATASSSSSSSPAAAVLEQARRAEPLRSELARTGNQTKTALLEASRLAREQVLESLAAILEPLRSSAAGTSALSEQEKAVQKAEQVWERYIDAERDRLWEYNKDKVRLAMEKEKERRMAALSGNGEVDDAAGEATRYKVTKRRIERALAAAGAPVRPSSSTTTAGEKSWKDVTAARIKGVNDKYRYRYHMERNKKEAEMGKTVKEFDWEEAVNKVERYEPSLPSSFVTALLRLSFPIPLADPAAAVEIAALPAPGNSAQKSKNAPVVWRHPTAIVGYLLKRELIGENQVEGGVTRFLARAGDWPNILIALRTIPDIPESTLVSLLVAVVRETGRPLTSSADGMDVDTPTTSLPAPVPAVSTFLAAFLQSPYTPSVLRPALQKQLSSDESVLVLEQCDAWLKRWLSEAEPVEAVAKAKGGLEQEEAKRKRKGKGSQAIAVDVFKVTVRAEDVPTMDQIVPFVQAILDAHFVNLLLQRQAHRLLRRLSQHVARHAEMTTDLGTLLGALSIYSSKKKEEQRRAAAAAADAATGKKVPLADGTSAGVKEFGATMEKRILAQEKHAEVGQYQVEEFFL